MKKTFLDANILIAAARGTDDVSAAAMSILDDPEREFVSSPFLKLEVFPKAVWNGRPEETKFYTEFFDTVISWCPINEEFTETALDVAVKHGLSAVDGLHVAAAILLHVDEFISGEKPSKPLYKCRELKMVCLRQK